MIETGSHLKFLRTFCWLTAGLYPSWSIFLALALPDEYDSLVGRALVGLCFALLAFAAGKSRYVKEHFEQIVYFGFAAVAVHFWYLVYRSNLSTVYVVGALIVAVCYNLGFAKVKPVALYSVVLVSLSLAVAIATDASLPAKLMLNAGILTVQICSLSSVAIRSRVLADLESERLKTVALKQQLVEQELEAAEAVQRTLLTRSVALPELDMATFYRAAARTGGDWYGHYHDARANVLYFWIGDVTGHGAASALITGVACGALYSGERRADHLGDSSSVEERLVTMASINNAVICSTRCELLMTMLFGAIELDTGIFRSINAGHTMPLLVSGGKATTHKLRPSNPLGFSEQSTYEVSTLQLAAGDGLFLYTDGLLENVSMTRVARQRNRLMQALGVGGDCRDVIRCVEREFADALDQTKLNDDVTFMSLIWRGPAALNRKAG